MVKLSGLLVNDPGTNLSYDQIRTPFILAGAFQVILLLQICKKFDTFLLLVLALPVTCPRNVYQSLC